MYGKANAEVFLRYGGSAPVQDGNVILDLHRMDKILEINEEYGYAIVEPGVSFIQLYDEIQRRKLNLWLSVPAIGWGSVIGNTLERGIGYTPEAVHYKHQSGMEVVLPNGDLLRTGMGAMDGSKVWPLYSGYVLHFSDAHRGNLVLICAIQRFRARTRWHLLSVQLR